MECTGKLTGAMRSLDGKSLVLTFEVDQTVANQIEQIRKQDKLTIKATKYRQKRSLDANAYAWVLMTKIADVVRSSKEEIYEEMLQRYGTCYEDENGYVTITVKKSVDMSKIDGHWKCCGGNDRFDSYLMIKGSSEYDTAEMSHFIDHIVQEAQELGIETATPDELARMKQEWGA